MTACPTCQRDVPAGGRFCPYCSSPVAPQTATSRYENTVVGGRYDVNKLLGRGGMGEVYKATDMRLDRAVVLKILRAGLADDPALVQRFHREARAASRLNHPNSVSVIDFGQEEGSGALFIVMEYLAGRSLAQVIAEEFPLDEARVVHIAAQILAALAEAHALGVIHRDLKPDNVIVESRRDDADFVKVLDFGIAQLNDPGADAPRLTQAGFVPGTPGYMSPEQVRGGDIDARSDLYAVGVILYEMVTGALPYDAATPMSLVTKILVEDPIPLRTRRPEARASPGLERVIERAMATDREQRFASADEMRVALLALDVPAPASRRTPVQTPTVVLDRARTPARGSGFRPHAAPMTPAPAGGGTVAFQRRPSPAPPPHPPSAPPHDTAASEAIAKATARSVRSAPPEPPASAVEPAPAPTRAARRRAPIVAGAAAGALLLGGVAWKALSRPHPSADPVATTSAATPAPPPSPAPPAPPPAQEIPPAPAPAPAASAASPPAVPQPAPAVPQPAPAPAPGPQVTAPQAPEVKPQPARTPPAAAAATKPKPPPPAAAAPLPAKQIYKVSRRENEIALPDAGSGKAILYIDASPWAQVEVDGRKVAEETPVWLLVEARGGTYHVSAIHLRSRSSAELRPKAGAVQRWTARFK